MACYQLISPFAALGVTLEVGRIECEKSNARALVRAYTNLPGYEPWLMHDTGFNLTSTPARKSLAKYLGGRLNLFEIRGIDWESIIEKVCGISLGFMRDGPDVATLGTIPRGQRQRYLLNPLVLHADRTLIFGDSGTAKSTIALAVGMAYKTGLPLAGMTPTETGNVLVCDWETDGETAQARLDSLVRGAELTQVHLDGPDADCDDPNCSYPHIFFLRCYFPLVEMADAIARLVVERGIGLVIVDSLTFAAAGSAKDEDTVIPMFNAMRRWKCSVLIVDHVTVEKDGREQSKPYGSRFKRNAARLMWHVRAVPAESAHELSVGLFSEKGNFSGRMPDVGLRLSYYRCGLPTAPAEEADEIRIVEDDPRSAPEQRKNLSHSAQILLCLREARTSLTKDDIAGRTGIKPDIVKARLNELKKVKQVVALDAEGTQSARRWVLASHRDEDEA